MTRIRFHARDWRTRYLAAVVASLVISDARAQDFATNAAAAPESPPAPETTNSTASAEPPPAPGPGVTTNMGDVPEPIPSEPPTAPTFLENHLELALPAPGAQGGFSLGSQAISFPDFTPKSGDLFPEPTSAAPAPPPAPGSDDLAAHLLVVYNTKDKDSHDLAEYYAAQRGIPAERVLGIGCSTAEEITRTEFENNIRSPIVNYLIQKNWMDRHSVRARVAGRVLSLLMASRNDIWAIALIRGVPLKIAPDPSDLDSMDFDPGLQTNAAAVDSELAMLPIYGLPRGGYVPNVFFDDQISGIKNVGPTLAKDMVLVTRLDGPSVADVRRMIDDSIAVEKTRLAGLAVVDSRGITDVHDGYMIGDLWLRSARESLLKDGWVVNFDTKPEVLLPTDTSNRVAIYLGWYHDNVMGPWITPPDRFVPGAVAYHLHSFSAATVRSTTLCWVGPLIERGADATMGTVYEPYLTLTPHEDIFMRRLLAGATFAEAAYASERGLSWMLTVVGDPLYRPFATPLDAALAQVGPHRTMHDDWLLVQKLNQKLAAGQMGEDAGSIRNALDIPGAGPVAQEALGDLLAGLDQKGFSPLVEQAYQKALAEDTEGVDRIRVGVKLSDYYATHGQQAKSQSELDGLRSLYPDDAKRFGIPDALVPTSTKAARKSH